jgi:hypothetical protein
VATSTSVVNCPPLAIRVSPRIYGHTIHAPCWAPLLWEMAMAGATWGSAWEAWGKGVGAICGSILQDTRVVLPMFAPPGVKTYVLVV